MSYEVASYAIQTEGSSMLRATHRRDAKGEHYVLATPTGEVVASEFHEHDADRTFQAFVVDAVLAQWNRGRP